MSPPSPTLHHVNLKTTRLEEMIAWYGRVAGFEVVHRGASAAWLSNDAANHRLALVATPGLADDPGRQSHAGLHHTAFEFGSFDELMGAYERLRKDGIEPAFCLDHGMTMSLYYCDPDGNFVELQSDNFGDWARSKAHMRTSPEFEANPVGVHFDPARLLAAHRSGRPFEELHRAAMAGAFEPKDAPGMGLPPSPDGS